MIDYDKVNRVIKERCGVVTDLDAQQIFEIILSMVSAEQFQSKYVVFEQVLETWEDGMWAQAMKYFYDSFLNANLARIIYRTLDVGDMSARIEDRKSICEVKNAPNNYYLQLLNYELDRPEMGQVLRGDERDIAAIAMYVALVKGDNMSTIGYPPEVFIKDVAGLDCSRADFYATVIDICKGWDSFETFIKTCADDDEQTLTQISNAYDAMIEAADERERQLREQRRRKEEAQKEKKPQEEEKPQKEEKPKKEKKQREKKILNFEEEDVSEGKFEGKLSFLNTRITDTQCAQVLQSAGDRFVTMTDTISARRPSAQATIWLITLAVNGIAVVFMAFFIIMALLNNTSTSVVSTMPLIGTFMSGVGKLRIIAYWCIRIIISSVVAMAALRYWRYAFDPRKRDSVFTMILLLILILCSVYNGLMFIKAVFAFIKAAGKTPYWGYFFTYMGTK